MKHFSYFSQKTAIDITCKLIVSIGENLLEMSYFVLSPVEFVQRVERFIYIYVYKIIKLRERGSLCLSCHFDL